MPSPEVLPILKRLNAAVGYHNLGTPQDAWNELEDIDADDRAPARRTSFSPLPRPLHPAYAPQSHANL